MPHIKNYNPHLSGGIADQHVHFWSHLDVELHYSQSTTLLFTGIQHPWFNGILRSNLPRNNALFHIDHVTAQFKLRRLPFVWITNAENSSVDYNKLLVPKGFQSLGKYPRMGIAIPPPIVERSVPLLHFGPVLTAEELIEWGAVVQQGFDWPEQGSLYYRNLFQHREFTPPYHHFLGKFNGKAVAAATLFVEQEVAGIYNFTVIPEARKNGIAFKMMQFLYEFLRDSSSKIVIVQATPQSFPFFQNLGFQTIFDFEVYASF